MNITTKFQPGDSAFRLHDNKVQEVEIASVEVHVGKKIPFRTCQMLAPDIGCELSEIPRIASVTNRSFLPPSFNCWNHSDLCTHSKCYSE